MADELLYQSTVLEFSTSLCCWAVDKVIWSDLLVYVVGLLIKLYGLIFSCIFLSHGPTN